MQRLSSSTYHLQACELHRMRPYTGTRRYQACGAYAALQHPLYSVCTDWFNAHVSFTGMVFTFTASEALASAVVYL